MACSSTSSICKSKSFKYDVFLSFRGEDTRTNFVDHLYHALQNKRIHTYKDDRRIKKGKNISDELIRSIEDSQFYIIVFSKNYASSSWCLDELVKIIECHNTTEHTAYPIFYDVEPSEVRNQRGAVAEAFGKHENEESAWKWRQALKEAADLAGWELKKTADGHEATFIQKIVEELSLELCSIRFNIDEKLVGMETRINDVVSSLGIHLDDVHIIGIKGMGGGGKTTLARAIFDQISFQFEGKSFVENVRDVSKASMCGLTSLQKQVLSDVLNDKDISISNVFDGKHMMKKMMHERKVLVVLDDVDDIDQLEALAGEPNWFGHGSTIIITTRDEQVLVAHRVKLIRDVSLLSDKEAICLFSRHAFGREIPFQGYVKLSRQVVSYAAGLPLTIRVLGSFLCGKNELEWIDAIERLKTIPLTETLKKLELSYIGLEEDYKEMFLDVACILKGWWKDNVIKALESCGFYARTGLRVLEQKSLITIQNSNNREYVDMHSHIEELGKNIVRRLHPEKPHNHSRLWKTDEIEDILANDLVTKATRCILLHNYDFNQDIVMKGLKKMKELRFLSLGNHFLSSKYNIVRPEFSNALQYLRFGYYPFWSLPQTFQANNLVTLEMADSKILQLWEGGERKVLTKLRFLDLSRSALRTLDLGLTPNLETLNLGGCFDLVELHISVECLNLKSIDLTRSMLRTLDVGLAPNLENLDLDDCYFLEELHMENECRKLANLKISHSKLRTLNLGRTPNLKTLHLKECCNLVELLTPMGCLRKLVHLDISGCFGFRSILFNLKDTTSCRVHESLEVDPLAELHLVVMALESCSFHPTNILPSFHFSCSYEEDRPSLTRIIEMLLSIGMCTCTNLETFSRSISGLQRLRKLKFEGDILEAPKDLGRLECLEELILVSTTMDHLPHGISMLKHLKSLQLNLCVGLEKLPMDLGQLECLEKLDLSHTKIKYLPDSICMLKHLKSLELQLCVWLEKLPKDLGQLECLEKLDLSHTQIKYLPDSICMLKNIKSLKLNHCVWLEKLPKDLGQLECLEELDFSYTKIKHLPNSICRLKHLKSLKLRFCCFLEKFPKDHGQLECLEDLILSFTRIRHLPDSICMLKHLKSLELISCSLLQKLPEDLGRLECLEKLSLNNCQYLQDLPISIGKIKGLKYFHLPYCKRVEKWPKEFESLTCLKELDIEGTCITHLPKSILLLKDVHIIGYRGLVQSFGLTSEIQTPECETSYVRLHANGTIFRISERLGEPSHRELL